MQVAIDNNEQYVWTAGNVKPNGGATAGYPSSKSGGRRFWWYHGSIGGVDRYEPISFNLATDPLPGYYGSNTAWPQGMPWDPEPGAGSTVDTGWALRFKASEDSWAGGGPLGTWRSRNKAGTNDKYKPVCEGVQIMPTPPTVEDSPPPSASPSPPPSTSPSPPPSPPPSTSPSPPPLPPLPPPSPLLPTYGYYLQPNNGPWGATTQQCRDTGGRPAMPRSMAEHTAIQQFWWPKEWRAPTWVGSATWR